MTPMPREAAIHEWSKCDPRLLKLDYFRRHPEVSWPVIREIFYDHFGAARPNRAHEVLAAFAVALSQDVNAGRQGGGGRGR
jgi:NAD-dependent SIR2 family protein deacetylase